MDFAKKFLIICVSVIIFLSCQSVKLVGKSGVELTNKGSFTLHKDATFRPFNELRSEPELRKETCYAVKWQPYPTNLSKLKKEGGGTALNHSYSHLSPIWIKMQKDALAAYVKNDSKIAMSVIDGLYQFASNDVMLGTVDAYTAFHTTCWGNGPSGMCPAHHAQGAAYFFINAVHAAILIRPWLEMKSVAKTKIDIWFQKGYRKYIKDYADYCGKGPNGGLYQFMNGKTGVLIYAIYRDDSKLFLSYAKKGIAQINQHMDDYGYIYNNSWRGVRSLMYHSLGLDAVFGFGEILETQGISFYDHPLLKDKLRKSYIAALKGEDDPIMFEAKGYKGTNYVTDVRDARRHLCGNATALQWIGAWRYPDIGQKNLPQSFDEVTGIDINCMYVDRLEQLSRYKWNNNEH